MKLKLLVFVVGAASLGAEIAAARLLAPWFGASTIVWANTIATVLVALSIGYAIGGRLADRHPTPAGLSRIVVVAAVLLALVPFVSGPLLRRSLDAFEGLSIGMFLGSLLGVSVLIAVPVLLLGMVSPYAVKLSLAGLGDAGRTTGRLYALGTLGSLFGTFLATLALIPLVGTRRTFLILALALAAVALLELTPRIVGVVALVGIGALIALPTSTVKATADGKVIWEHESEYQYARVIESPAGTRTLELNEGQAVHSLYRPGSWLTGGYWDDMTVIGSSAPPDGRVAILGSAAGTSARAIAHYRPDLSVDAVEIDPEVTKVGRELFDLRGRGIRTHTADARPWLHGATPGFDTILVDAYRQPYIPFYLATHEFFALVKDKLADGGVVAINVGHPEQSDKLEKALTATAGSVFAHVWRDPLDETNTILLASDTDPRPSLQRLGTDTPDLAESTTAVVDRLDEGLRGGPVYTDDKAPVEWLIDASLAEVAE